MLIICEQIKCVICMKIAFVCVCYVCFTCIMIIYLSFNAAEKKWVWYYGILKVQKKGALDKYNIYLFIFKSIEDLKLNQYQNFQLILPMFFFPYFLFPSFFLMRYFVNSIFRVSHRLLYCVFEEFICKTR